MRKSTRHGAEGANRPMEPDREDHPAALFAVLGEALPVRLVCAVAEGWAQESQDQLAR